LEGETIVRYLCNRGVQINEVCSDLPELSINDDMPVVTYDNILDRDKDSFIILTMSNVYWQSSYITKLRKSGFENIILISDNILKAIKYYYRRIIWEEVKVGFNFIKTANIERDFYLVQKEQGMHTYRWRIAALDGDLHKKSVLDSIKSGKMVEAYEKQFPGFSYLPYKEVPLYGINNENLNIEINDEILTISAFNEVDELNLENRNYLHQERNFGMFERSFCLKNLNTENVEAKYNDGILSIEIIKNNQDEKINRVEIK